MPSETVLQYPVERSPCFAALLLALHLLAATVLCATAMPLPFKLVGILLILLSLIYYIARDVLLLFPDSWHAFAFQQKCANIITMDGSAFSGQIASKTFVSAYFVVLCVRLEGRIFLSSRVLFPDALKAGKFREICVWLKFA